MMKYTNSNFNQRPNYRRSPVLFEQSAALISLFNCKHSPLGFLLIVFLINASPAVEANNCTVTADSNTTLFRKIELNVYCPDSPFFKLSESPEFKETETSGAIGCET